ncbi:MAG: hypothetical protein GC166_03655 [Alphaproteobacteria bacterium]|nr:hypothetical protein [Alphaproteobacteria bacterium]
MAIKQRTLRWAVTSILAIITFAVLAWLDTKLKSETGYGTLALQSAGTAENVNRILFAWRVQQHTAMAGFSLGFDYLFMPLWGFGLYYGALAARDAFAPKMLFRIFTLLAAVPLAGAIFDAIENTLEFSMLMGQPSDHIASLAVTASTVKSLCFFVGLALWVLGLLGLLRRKKEA